MRIVVRVADKTPTQDQRGHPIREVLSSGTKFHETLEMEDCRIFPFFFSWSFRSQTDQLLLLVVGTGAIEAGPVSNTSCSSRCVAASGSTVDGDVVTPDATATADACRCQPDCLSDGSCCSDFVAVCLGGSGKRILQSIHDC